MQLASHGGRGIARKAPNIVSAGRSLHTARILPQIAPPGVTHRLISQTRLIFGRFVSHLTAPGIGSVPSVTRSITGSASGRLPTITQRLSLPVRTKLSRPQHPLYFPRAPSSPSPCSVTNMGLGSARNFSSGRSVFQNLVENVPIAGRAFYEADWDVKASKEREMLKNRFRGQGKKTSGGKQTLKPRNQMITKPSKSLEVETQSEMDKYFTSTALAPVVTYLLIPLAPTPSERLPLPGDNVNLLPWPDIARIHNSHELHSLRVSSLFSRLDASNVWERGVLCSAYAQRAGPEGVCTILKVEFVGWTKNEVRSVIGESGTGWCVLEESQGVEQDNDSDLFSDTSSVTSDLSGDSMAVNFASDMVTQSFVLPTLDFSSTFLQTSIRSPSESDSFSDTGSDVWSDSSENWIEVPSDGWLGFSSDFVKIRNAFQFGTTDA